MVRVSHELQVIHFAERHIDRQLVGQRRRGVCRIGLRVERVDVADESALRMREIGDACVCERKTRRGGVGVAGVLGEQVMRLEAEQADVSPDARMKLLRVHQQERCGGYRIGVRAEVGNVRNPLLLVHDQILDDVQILGARLECEMTRRVAIGAAVVHVDMHVPAPPSLSWKVGNALESNPLRHSPTRRHVHVGTKHLILGTSPHLDVHLPGGHRELARPCRVEIGILELPLGAIKRLVRMAPHIIRRIASAL